MTDEQAQRRHDILLALEGLERAAHATWEYIRGTESVGLPPHGLLMFLLSEGLYPAMNAVQQTMLSATMKEG